MEPFTSFFVVSSKNAKRSLGIPKGAVNVPPSLFSPLSRARPLPRSRRSRAMFARASSSAIAMARPPALGPRHGTDGRRETNVML